MKNLNSGTVEANVHRTKLHVSIPETKSKMVATAEVPGTPPKSILAGEYREIPLDQIDPCPHPVRPIDGEVVEDIRIAVEGDGLYGPLIVRPKPPDRFEVVAGTHRYNSIALSYRMLHEKELAEFVPAKKQTPWPLVPCIIRELGDADAQLVSIAENIHRNDNLDPITEGEVFVKPMDANYTPQQILERIGKKQLPYVTNRILLATKLHEQLKQKVRYGQLNVLDAVRIAGFPLANQLDEHKRRGRQKHGPVDKSEKCSHKCARHCPGAA